MTWKDRLKMFALGLTTATATTSCVGVCEKNGEDIKTSSNITTELADLRILEDGFPEKFEEHKEKLAEFNKAERPADDRVPSDEIIELKKQLEEAKIPLAKDDSVLVSFTRINNGTEENPQYEFTDLQYINKNQPQAVITKQILNEENPHIVRFLSAKIYDSKDYSLDENTADIRMSVSDYEYSLKESREAIERHKREYYDSVNKVLVKEIQVLPEDVVEKKIRDTFYLNYIKNSKKRK